MRPQKFNYLMNKAIQQRLQTGDNSLFDAQLKRAMKKAWLKYAKEENDHRTLTDISGYGFEDEESINSTLFYISDRWRCAFRLRWLIEGLERGKI